MLVIKYINFVEKSGNFVRKLITLSTSEATGPIK